MRSVLGQRPQHKVEIMESPRLLLVAICVLAGTISGHEAKPLHSGCRWDRSHSLSCRSSGISIVEEHLFMDPRNVTAAHHLPRYLQAIQHVDLSYNSISTLHLKVFYTLSSLKSLNIDNNNIYRVSIQINEKHQEKLASLTALHMLLLSQNRLVAIPKGLGSFQSLRTLNLSANRIAQIRREDFANCSELQNVDLEGNRIHSIHPDAFQDLTNLQVLKLHSNALVSLSPLVFLFSHVLRADIDLSDNEWACDCSLQPLKQLVSFLTTGGKRPWNITCSSPPPMVGQHLLSTENLPEPCPVSRDDYTHARRIVIPAGEEATLDCDTSNQSDDKQLLWWTPHGLISKVQDSKYYFDSTNNIILSQPDDSDEGLYICLQQLSRIAYQVSIQRNDQTSLRRRSPRDLQYKSARALTQDNCPLALSLSVLFTFMVAFCLGVFLRPYLESLWIKCKSQNKEKQNSGTAYDNEGFTQEERNKSSQGNNLQQRTIRDDSSSDSDVTSIDGRLQLRLNAENAGRKELVVEIENPSGEAYQERAIDVNVSPVSPTKVKRVTWASNEGSSFRVNLKDVMSLLKPIHLIVPESSMVQVPSTNSSSELYDNTSSDEGSTFSLGSEYYDSSASDEDRTLDTNSSDNLTINLRQLMSLLKPIRIRCPDLPVPSIRRKFLPSSSSIDQDNRPHYAPQETLVSEDNSSNKIGSFKKNELTDTSSDEGSSYSYDSEDEFSDQEESRTKASSLTVNLAQVISSFKPANIIVPELTTTTLAKHPSEKHLFPLGASKYPDRNLDNLEKSPHSQLESQPLSRSGNYHSETIDKIYSSDEESSFSVNSEEYFSAEDAFVGSPLLKNKSSLKNKDIVTPTVNLKVAVSSLKPIKFIIPDSMMTQQTEHHTQQQLFPFPIYVGNRMDDVTQEAYDSSSSSDSSEVSIISVPKRSDSIISAHDSSDDSIISVPDISDKDPIKIPMLPKPSPTKWPSIENIDVYPTVNIRQAMALIKPLKIILPDSSRHLERLSPVMDIDLTGQRLHDSESSHESTDFDHSSSDEEELRSPNLFKPKPTTWQNNENEHSVNLKYFMSLIKPIHINILDETKLLENRNNEVTHKLNDSSSDDSSVDSEHEGSHMVMVSNPKFPEAASANLENYENLTPTVNLKYIASSLKPIKLKVPDILNSLGPPSPAIILDVSPKQSHSSSSDETSSDSEAETSYDDVTKIPPMAKLESTVPYSNENVHPTVNLKYIVSSFKPIQLKAPERLPLTPIIKLEESPKQGYSSSSDETLTDSEAETSDDDVTKLPFLPKLESTVPYSNENVHPTVNLKYIVSSFKPIQFKAPEILPLSPIIKIEGSQKQIHSSSSDETSDSDAETSDDEVRKTSTMAKLEATLQEPTEYVYPTINLKYIVSSFKPIQLKVHERLPLSPIINLEVYQKQSDSSSSDDNLTDSEDDVKTSSLPTTLPQKWPNTGILTSTINLKHIISSFQPIQLKIADPTTLKSSFDSSSSSSESEPEESFENIVVGTVLPRPDQTDQLNSEDLYPTVDLKHVISLIKPIQIKLPSYDHYSAIPISPNYKEVTHSKVSSDSDSESESSDEAVITPFFPPSLEVNSAKEDINPTVNFKNVSSFRPINVFVPNEIQYSEILPPFDETTMTTQKLYHSSSSSSEDESNISLLEPVPLKQASNDHPNHTVNLGQVITSFNPIIIKVPDSIKYSAPTTIPIPRIDVDSSSDESSDDSADSGHEGSYEVNLQKLHGNSSDTSNDSGDFNEEVIWISRPTSWPSTVGTTINLKDVMSSLKPLKFQIADPRFSEPVTIPKANAGVNRELSDSWSEDSSTDEDDSMTQSSILLRPSTTEWTRNDDPYETVNLKYVMSLLKPIQITSQDLNPNLDTLISAKDTDIVTQKPYDSKVFDDSSSDSSTSDHEDLDKSSAKVYNSAKIIPEISSHQDYYPTLNLGRVMALLKPIKIKVPDFNHVSPPEIKWHRPYDKSSDESSSDSDNSESEDKSEITLYRPHFNISSDPGHADSEGIKGSTLFDPAEIEWANNRYTYPTVNLKNVTSFLKPISFIVPETEDYEVVKNLSSMSFVPSQNPENKTEHFDDHHSENNQVGSRPKRNILHKLRSYAFQSPNKKSGVILTSYKKTDNQLDEKDGQRESKGNLQYQETVKPKWSVQANSATIAPEVNLKQAVSLIKPVHILSPDVKETEVDFSTQKVHPPNSLINMKETGNFIGQQIVSTGFTPNTDMDNYSSNLELHTQISMKLAGQTKVPGLSLQYSEDSDQEISMKNKELFGEPVTQIYLDGAVRRQSINRDDKAETVVPSVTSPVVIVLTSSESITHRESKGKSPQSVGLEANLNMPMNEQFPSFQSHGHHSDHDNDNDVSDNTGSFSLYTQESMMNPIVDAKALTALYLESPSNLIQVDGPMSHQALQDAGEMTVNVRDSFASMQAADNVPLHTTDIRISDDSGMYLAKRVRVFDAFSDSLRSGDN